MFYRKKQHAYRELVRKNREWAQHLRVLPSKSDDADKTETAEAATMKVICCLFDEKRVYLDPTLTLDALALQAGSTRSAVSQAINNTQKKSFNTFLNDYRTGEAIRLLSNPDFNHVTLETIAYESGFNSIKTFYRAFRSQTGITPAQFRRNNP